MKTMNNLRATVVAAVLATGSTAWATNGMLMEGYGPQALSMGGAAQAYDNGTAGMMNNPATLQLSANGTRADFALGVLGPKVTSMGEKSGGTSYVMPAFGWVRKNDQYSYGIGVFGQGGMGTEYAAGSMNAARTPAPVRSELAVGRVILPGSYKVNDQLNVGATLDFTWASLDMRMAALFGQMAGMNPMPTGQLAQMMGGMTTRLVNETDEDYAQRMQQLQQMPVRIDFSNNNDFTGQAKSTGLTGKLGLTYLVNPDLTVAASYQLKTNLGDMETSGSGATLTMGSNPAMVGKMVVNNFQMPAVLAVGASWVPAPRLQLVADVKRIDWSSVMSSFRMSFELPGGSGGMGFTLPQNWKDQTVISLGGAYKATDAWTLRAGYSHSSNPISDAMVHPLFPAIIKNHLTAGFGYQINKNLSLDGAVSYAPKVTVVAGQLGGQNITHGQTNYQVLLGYRY
ncbi:OmpP1/FadL family transporter [Limnohabitans sp. DCL3]|uniref:OmpP1/FadL family transporter n=1 Tax=Limnohabitans sp. DCL3 TaxID=3374103 RepID=UPI003A847F92